MALLTELVQPPTAKPRGAHVTPMVDVRFSAIFLSPANWLRLPLARVACLFRLEHEKRPGSRGQGTRLPGHVLRH